ncbi:hypothetical protein EDC94DRAFT_673268 [Helicostylum pulchrum]|nr:hypothetical protein EDC94DRAFT_673268 [Helicostylum pulchrum]
MNEDDIYIDPDLDLLTLDSPTPNDQDTDDFGDDLDLAELVETTEVVEQQHASKSGIIFTPIDDTDPTPPPALPDSTPSFHALDIHNLRTWIYPTNYPVRGYQLNIVQKAMFQNTLVALPTGLGKTFIAAVVMYNYWRWFPNSKIVFMAPTRPLVTQQIEACFTICGLPQQDTTDMSGSTTPEKRAVLWKEKRVFFATPHVVYNDLIKNTCPGDRVVCIVVDEAHKATGNYAYVQVIRKIAKKNKHFRVLALTATPGSNLDTVQTVVSNLQITNIQIRTEDSMDIQEYSYGKSIQSIIVPLNYTEGSTGILPRVVEEFKTQVFEPMLRELSQLPTGVSPEAERCSPFGLQSCRTRFQANCGNLNPGLKFRIFQKFMVAEQMSRAYDLLCQHGIAPFFESTEANRRDLEAKKMNQAENHFYHNSYMTRLIPKLKQDMQDPEFIGHPKIDKLVSILLKHFSDLPPGSASKAMIFSSYRSSVNEICKVLDRHQPMIRCSFFVGQADGKNGSKGLKQSEQQEVIQKFKKNEFNVLVSTSIGEEGLDIGEIDIIICYDSQSSPLRMLQRMGRTGRKRQGKCVLLMTESEGKKFAQAKVTYANVQRLISQGVHLEYYRSNPTVIPANYKPTLCRKALTVGTFQPKEKKRKRGSNLTKTSVTSDGTLKPDIEESFIRSFCNGNEAFTNLSQVFQKYWPTRSMKKSLAKHIPLQTKPTATHRVGHSKRTHNFIELVQKMEHRILNPSEDVSFTLPKKQTKLVLPSKAVVSNKLIMNKRKKKQYDEYGEPEENNCLANFLDPDAMIPTHGFEDKVLEDIQQDFAPSTSKRVMNDIFEPRKRVKAPSVSKESFVVDKKGKGKFVDKSEELPFPLDDMSWEMPDIGTSKGKTKQTQGSDDEVRSWSPLLPDSIFEPVSPLKDAHALPPRKLPLSPLLPASPLLPSDPPIQSETADEITEINIADLYNQDSDDEFGDDDDFALDELFIKESEAWLELRSRGFDDKLDPVFAFEKNQPPNDTFAFVWANSSPRFSDKALALLEKRQQAFKKRTGRFIAMSLFEKYNNLTMDMKTVESPKVDTKPVEPPMLYVKPVEYPKLYVKPVESPSLDDEFGTDDSLFEQAAALENQLQQKSTINASGPVIINLDPSQELVKEFFEDDGLGEDDLGEYGFGEDDIEETEGGGFSDIDFDGNELATFFQDQYNEEDMEYAPFSLNEPEYAPSQRYTSQMKEKASLYGKRSPSPIELPHDIFSSPPHATTDDAKPQDNVYNHTLNQNNADIDFDAFSDFSKIGSSEKPDTPVLRDVEVYSIASQSDIESSPRLLSQLARGIQKSPAHASPLARSPYPHDSDSEEDSPVIKRKRRFVNGSPMGEQVDRPKKRLRQRAASTPLKELREYIFDEDVDGDNDDDDDLLMYEVPSSKNLLSRLEQSKRDHGPPRSSKLTKLAENPFFDVEAEKSSDEGHTTDEELNSESSAMRSFIDYEEQSRVEDTEDNAIYQRDADDMPSNAKHWLNRFNAEKWLNPVDDSIVEEDEEEDEEESSTSIAESQVLVNNDDDDDDFI